MKITLTSPRFLVVPSIALLGLGALAGCGESKDNASPSESSSSTSATTSESSPAGSFSTSEPTSASASESNSASASSSASDAAASTEGTIVTAAKNKIAFAVPQGWETLSAADVDYSNPEVQKLIEEVSKNTGTTPEEFEAQMKNLDLNAYSTSMTKGVGDNVNVAADPVPGTQLPTEAEMKDLTNQLTATPKKYEKITTPLGEGISQTYTLDVAGQTMNGQYLIVPNGTGDSLSIITVTSPQGDTAPIADQIIKTLKKA